MRCSSMFHHVRCALVLFALSIFTVGCGFPKTPKRGSATPASPGSATPDPRGSAGDLGFAVNSFDRCVAAGASVMESHPRQCEYGAKHFVEDIRVGNKGDTRNLVLRIESQDSECTGAHGSRRCLVANGELFYDDIVGFIHTPGQVAIIEVERTQICDPKAAQDCPQDRGIYRYKLLRVISPSSTQEADPAAMNYLTFRGTITQIEPGKDGSTVELSAADGQKLYAVLSIPNLGPDSDFDFGAIKLGTVIEVQGEPFKLGDRRQMAAKKARVVE